MGGVEATRQSAPPAVFYLGAHQPHWLEKVPFHCSSVTANCPADRVAASWRPAAAGRWIRAASPN
jgi:hypothetical protein